MNHGKRIFLIWLLVLLSLCTLTTVGAAQEYYALYSDISDEQTAFAVSVLEALDVVEGFPDGGFHPDDTLTRAQFCKMAVMLLGQEDKLNGAAQKTLFYDVTLSHWAAAYINLAYENGFIEGYGNGMFGPDDPLTYAQVLTILLRMLDYADTDIGSVYPDDFLWAAQEIGLTENVYCRAEDAVTRGEAAVLLVNLIDTETKSGNPFYKKFAVQSVSQAILLETGGSFDSWEADTVCVYVNNQAVRYPAAAGLSLSLIGSQGTLLVDEDGYALTFLPDGTQYRLVNGILLESSRRSQNEYAPLPYETLLYAEGDLQSYPRSGSISANLNGASGTLLLDEDGYACAFLADDISVYTVTHDAVLLDTECIDDKHSDCASFYINGRTVCYEMDYDSEISIYDIGMGGILLTDEDSIAAAFLPSENSERYETAFGILLACDTREASFLIDGYETELDLDCTLAANLVGSSGMILLDEDRDVIAYFEKEKGGSVKSEVILLDDNCISDSGRRHCIMVYENGKIKYYEQEYDAADRSMIGASGTLICDEDDVVIGFTPNGEYYEITYGLLLESTSSKASFYIAGDTFEWKLACSLPQGSVGKSGMILLQENHRIAAFIPDEDAETCSFTQSGILLVSEEIAADGKTVVAKLYADGTVHTYKTLVSISDGYTGECGKLMLNEDDCVIGFLAEETNRTVSMITEVCEDTLVTEERSYGMYGNIPVLYYGEIRKWNEVWEILTVGENAAIYFDAIGSIEVVMIG